MPAPDPGSARVQRASGLTALVTAPEPGPASILAALRALAEPTVRAPAPSDAEDAAGRALGAWLRGRSWDAWSLELWEAFAASGLPLPRELGQAVSDDLVLPVARPGFGDRELVRAFLALVQLDAPLEYDHVSLVHTVLRRLGEPFPSAPAGQALRLSWLGDPGRAVALASLEDAGLGPQVRAVLLTRAGAPRAALERARELDAKNAWAWGALALLEARDGDPDLSRTQARQALRLAQEQYATRTAVGAHWRYRLLEQPALALILTGAGDEATPVVELARALASSNDEAREFCQQLSALHQVAPARIAPELAQRATMQEAVARARAGELALATSALRALLKHGVLTAELWRTFGETLIVAEQLPEARRALDASLQLDPETAQTWRLRALAAEADQEAEAYLGEALRRAPQLAQPWAERGVIRARRGEHAGALEDLDRAIALAPEDADHFATRALIHKAAGHYDAAAQDWSRALTLEPGQPDHAFHAAEMFLQVARYREALSAAQHGLALAPDRAPGLALYAEILVENERPEEAREALRRALELEPDHDRADAWRAFAARLGAR